MKKVNWAKVSLVVCIVTYVVLFSASNIGHYEPKWIGLAGFFLVYATLGSLVAVLVQTPDKETD